MKYESVLQAVRDTPWAILPSKLAAIQELLALRSSGVRFSDEEIQGRIGMATERPQNRRAGSVAVLPLFGFIAPRMNMMTEMSGGTSAERFTHVVRQTVADPNISGIVLDVNSPGGSAFGLPELADEIRAAASQKPVVAIANHQAASAAYYLASQASELMGTPSSQVGSIGTIIAHEDISGLEEKMGVRHTLITAGKYKAEANPYEPLTDEARDYLQGMVNEYNTMFVNAVARGRGVSASVVREQFGEGRMFLAKNALRLGMIDRIGTLDDAIARAASGRVKLAGIRAESDEGTYMLDEEGRRLLYEALEAYEFPVSAGSEPEPEAADDLDLRKRRLRLAELA